MTRFRLPAIGLLLLVSSNVFAEVRVYDVDSQYRQEVFTALSKVLIGDPTQVVGPSASYGRVQLLPSGQLLVDAGPQTHAQVEMVLKAIKERPVTPAARVSLRYWAVLGVKPGTDVSRMPGGTQPPPGLQAVLSELKQYHGQLDFRVIGTAAVVTQSGEPGGVEGTPLRVSQQAYVQGQSLSANIGIKLSVLIGQPQAFATPERAFGELEVRATVQRGEFLVLGESTQAGNGLDGTLFYIVHWPENE
jgi:hypothetical protein